MRGRRRADGRVAPGRCRVRLVCVRRPNCGRHTPRMAPSCTASRCGSSAIRAALRTSCRRCSCGRGGGRTPSIRRWRACGCGCLRLPAMLSSTRRGGWRCGHGGAPSQVRPRAPCPPIRRTLPISPSWSVGWWRRRCVGSAPSTASRSRSPRMLAYQSLRSCGTVRESAVDLAPMSDGDHEDEQLLIANLVADP